MSLLPPQPTSLAITQATDSEQLSIQPDPHAERIEHTDRLSSLPKPIFNILRWVADRLAKYQTSAIQDTTDSGPFFPPIPLENDPDNASRLHSRQAKLGFRLSDLESKSDESVTVIAPLQNHQTPVFEKIDLDQFTDKELMVWIAKFLYGDLTHHSQTAFFNESSEEYLSSKINSAQSEFYQKAETAIFNLLKTLNKFSTIPHNLTDFHRKLLFIANQCQFKSCQLFLRPSYQVPSLSPELRITIAPEFNPSDIQAVSAALGVSPLPSGQFYLPPLESTYPSTANSTKRMLIPRTSLSNPYKFPDLQTDPIITITSIEDQRPKQFINYRFSPVVRFYRDNVSTIRPAKRRR